MFIKIIAMKSQMIHEDKDNLLTYKNVSKDTKYKMIIIYLKIYSNHFILSIFTIFIIQ